MAESVTIIEDAEGKKIAVINDLIFKSRKNIDWDYIEERLKGYIGHYYEILETSDVIYIGSDFPDEFTHSKDKINLKGANEKAKANLPVAMAELIEIASNRKEMEDYNKKHGEKAKYGWYKYITRFAIPIYNDEGDIEKYNVFAVNMLVRRADDGKLYLYDFVRTKKEGVQPASE